MWERALTSAPCRINNPIIATFRAATGLPPSVQITSGLRISQQAACINDVQPQLSWASISAPQPVSVLRASSRGPYSVAVRSSVSPKSFWADTSAPQFSGGAMTVGLSVRGPIPVSEPDASQTIGSRFNGVVHVMTLVRTNESINKADRRMPNAQVRFADALQRVFPTPSSSSPISWLDPPGDLVRLKFSNI